MRPDDYIDIQRLVHRYADAVVNRDTARWTSCWAPDALWDLGLGRAVTGIAAIGELWSTAMGTLEAVVQTVHNGDAWYTSEGSRDDAAGRWYISEIFQRVAAEDGRPGVPGLLRAHYDDTYTRAGSGWRFASRVLRVHYAGPPDLTASFLNTEQRLREANPSDD